jgi:ABC-type transport system involved in cytochrome bd biosynthesis fused ATPase/permease subunit
MQRFLTVHHTGGSNPTCRVAQAVVDTRQADRVYLADKIVVMKEGRIVEVGSHQELLDRSGEYRYLHDLQFQAEDTP